MRLSERVPSRPRGLLSARFRAPDPGSALAREDTRKENRDHRRSPTATGS